MDSIAGLSKGGLAIYIGQTLVPKGKSLVYPTDTIRTINVIMYEVEELLFLKNGMVSVLLPLDLIAAELMLVTVRGRAATQHSRCT